jgi:hypothetical protein
MSEVEVEAGANVITLDDYGTAISFIEQGTDVLPDGGEAESLGPGARRVPELARSLRDLGLERARQ